MTDGPGIASNEGAPSPPEGVERHALGLAISTLLARVSGYLRTVVLATTVGVGLLGNAFGTANAFPNMLFEILMGGGVRSVLVPTIVGEFERDPKDGWRTVSAIFNLTLLVLIPATAAGVLIAPLIFKALTLGIGGESAAQVRVVGGVLLALMVPQIIFYGVDLVATAVLHVHRRFVLPALAVVIGNAVIVAGLVSYALIRRGGASLKLSAAEYLLLGGGATVGVAAISIVELFALRRHRPKYSAVLGRGVEAVRRGIRAAGWMLVYVGSNQIGLIVVLILANRIAGGVAAYQYAFTFAMLPYGVVGLSLGGAMLPEASTRAARGDRQGVSELLARSLGWALVLLLPGSVVLVLAAGPITSLLIGYGASRGAGAEFVGSVLAAFAFGLVPFTFFQLIARAHYAFHNTKTPALVNVAAIAVNVVADIVLFTVLEGKTRIVGLAAGHALSYGFGAAALWLRTRPNLGFLPRIRIDLPSFLRR